MSSENSLNFFPSYSKAMKNPGKTLILESPENYMMWFWKLL